MKKRNRLTPEQREKKRKYAAEVARKTGSRTRKPIKITATTLEEALKPLAPRAPKVAKTVNHALALKPGTKLHVPAVVLPKRTTPRKVDHFETEIMSTDIIPRSQWRTGVLQGGLPTLRKGR